LSAGDIEQILHTCRVNNGIDGVTGILIYNGAAFLQVLEGTAQAVDETLERICADDRHRDIVVHDERSIAERAFPTWEMAYLHLPAGELLGARALERALDRPVPEAVSTQLQEISASLVARAETNRIDVG
jgi:hypothetical protein